MDQWPHIRAELVHAVLREHPSANRETVKAMVDRYIAWQTSRKWYEPTSPPEWFAVSYSETVS